MGQFSFFKKNTSLDCCDEMSIPLPGDGSADVVAERRPEMDPSCFVTPPDDILVCRICFDVMLKPHSCVSGHTFCHKVSDADFSALRPICSCRRCSG